MVDELHSDRRFTIRVSTPDPSGNPIAVRAAVYASDTTAVELIDRVTPFEVNAIGKVLCGMMQAVDATALIRVDVLATTGDAEPELMMSARARTVLLGNHLTREVGHFIRGAP